MTLQKLGLVELNNETSLPYGESDPKPTQDMRHEQHAATQSVYTVTHSAVVSLSTLMGGSIPEWATACRLYVGSASDIVYSTDGTDPAFSGSDATHGAYLEAYNRTGHLIPGADSVSGLKMIAVTADVSVTVELLG